MRKKTVLIGAIVLGLLVASMYGGAFAANPENVNVSAQVSPTVRLTMSETLVDFGGGPMEPGLQTEDITATVSSNRGWDLKVTKSQDMTGVAHSMVIPSASFTFGASTGDARVTYTAPASTQFGTDVTVCSGNRGGNMDTTVSYSLDIPWDVEPDTYTATHTYTATQP